MNSLNANIEQMWTGTTFQPFVSNEMFSYLSLVLGILGFILFGLFSLSSKSFSTETTFAALTSITLGFAFVFALLYTGILL
ncbi:hypothetical protein BB559_003644 [Furculomyces boomerangus]|uniref:Dolichyl-diphosphooligosaccharide-protein glycosyltransferase subunit OST5 n=2 Tax=Harpellales TaxID=61421 RepID=A0A2T9YJY0_9FUNG|nr:hypothetical protein BB559_004459 [Furculomyces boomerangus]PVU92637.1 hypothetical protein BB559_003644 [Furculomyces boomerangus]PVZ98500.1 hypothetical protein BB558_005497 [Smittium angustum]PVZ99124.1 hypothetical protein BB558_004860 [Smittium angustum]